MANTNIDTLTVEIEASSDKASQQINKTTEALKKLQAQVNKQYQNPIKGMASGGDVNKLSSELLRTDKTIERVIKNIERLKKTMSETKNPTIADAANRTLKPTTIRWRNSKATGNQFGKH